MMGQTLKRAIRQALDDVAGYARQAKAATHYSDGYAFRACLKATRAALARAEALWSADDDVEALLEALGSDEQETRQTAAEELEVWLNEHATAA